MDLSTSLSLATFILTIIGNIDPTALLAVATLLTALIALVGVIISLNSQKKRERQRWLDERRLEAHSRLAHSISEIASITGILGNVLHLPNVPKEIRHDRYSEWKQTQITYNQAKHTAILLAGKNVKKLIITISDCVDEMITALENASIKYDYIESVMIDGNPEGIETIVKCQKKLNTLRNLYINAVRNELGMIE